MKMAQPPIHKQVVSLQRLKCLSARMALQCKVRFSVPFVAGKRLSLQAGGNRCKEAQASLLRIASVPLSRS